MRKGRSKRIRTTRCPVISGGVIGLFFLLAVFGEFFAPYAPNELSLSKTFLPPFWQEGETSNIRWEPICSVVIC